ncbi:MAG TPA: VCBS repeat-containing protein [Pyrinomonadaceae bacterium]|nr:VCBS repeat-containing protein [Pyrinomonadaceae bacterium]
MIAAALYANQQTAGEKFIKVDAILKDQTHSVVFSAATLLILCVMSSCKAGGIGAGNPQRQMFAPAPGSPVAVACGTSGVVVGDMNNDGKPDLIVVCEQTRALTVLLATGGGAFRPLNPITVPDPPGNIELGDINGDKNLDLAIDSHDSYGVVLMLGDGKGGLAPAPNSPLVMKDGRQPHTHGLGLRDMNGDGNLDLLTVNNADNDVSVALGDGRGGFARAPATFAVGPSPYPFALGDANNDGSPDIVATATATGPLRAQQLSSSFALTLLLNDGRGGFRRSELPVRTGQPWFADLGDVNGDGKPDVIATHHDQSRLTVLLGDGAGRFSEVSNSPFDFGRSAFQVKLADVNRDGRLDALAAAGEGVRVMLGDGRGNFTTAPGSPFLSGRGVWRFAVRDMNGDGKLDLVTSNQDSRSVSILLGQ